MCGGACRALEWPRWAQNRYKAWVGPWQYQCSRLGACWVGTRYSTLPVPPLPHHPGYYPSPRTARMLPPTSTSRLAPTRVLRPTKEILGVDNARPRTLMYRSVPHASPYACHAAPWAGLLWQAVRLDRARVGPSSWPYSTAALNIYIFIYKPAAHILLAPSHKSHNLVLFSRPRPLEAY